MSTGEDSSFEELSYEYNNNDDDSSVEEFADLVQGISEGSAILTLELPISLLQLNDNELLLPRDGECNEDQNTNSRLSFVDESATGDAPLAKSRPAYGSGNSETQNSVPVEELRMLSSHFDSRCLGDQDSFSTGGWSSFVLSTMESTVASSNLLDYDIISVGGSIKRQCKRCTFIGNEEDSFCHSCELAWCPNPCTDADALIAAQMQYKEEESLYHMMIKEERMRESLRDQPANVQSQMLINDILRFVDGYSVGSETDGLIPCTFTELQLYMLAVFFITDFISRRNSENTFFSETRLYYYASSSEELARIRCGEGFLRSTVLRDNLEAAYQSAKTKRCVQEEDCSDDEDSPYYGWIVAISHHEHVKWTTLNNGSDLVMDDRWELEHSTDNKKVFHTYAGQAVLPLVYFDVSKHRNGADRMFHGLKQVCSDFFSHLRRIEPVPDIDVRHDGLLQRVEL